MSLKTPGNNDASQRGYLVLESGKTFQGVWQDGGAPRAGEIVFNTSHSGYEEIATDPSYYSQIVCLTAPMQGNYGSDPKVWESRQLWISGFMALEVQESPRDRSWRDQLISHKIPLLTGFDTRALALELRSGGTTWGALVQAPNEKEAKTLATKLIETQRSRDLDWAHAVSIEEPRFLKGQAPEGPRIAVLDFGCKENSVRELLARCSEVGVFPSRTPAEKIRQYDPQGVFLSNGPGDPEDVKVAVQTIKDLLGWRFIFGICMGHQLLARALGAKTYKLKFGHRASNHPVKDLRTGRIYMTSQNHGYAIHPDSLTEEIQVTHENLNDGTVSGIFSKEHKAMGVQFHPECHPGPLDSIDLFDDFIRQTI